MSPLVLPRVVAGGSCFCEAAHVLAGRRAISYRVRDLPVVLFVPSWKQFISLICCFWKSYRIEEKLTVIGDFWSKFIVRYISLCFVDDFMIQIILVTLWEDKGEYDFLFFFWILILLPHVTVLDYWQVRSWVHHIAITLLLPGGEIPEDSTGGLLLCPVCPVLRRVHSVCNRYIYRDLLIYSKGCKAEAKCAAYTVIPANYT